MHLTKTVCEITFSQPYGEHIPYRGWMFSIIFGISIMKNQPTFSMKMINGINDPDGICNDGIPTETIITGIAGIEFGAEDQIVHFVSRSAMNAAQEITGWPICRGKAASLTVEIYRNEKSVNMISCYHDNQSHRGCSYYSDWVILPGTISGLDHQPKSHQPSALALTAYSVGYLSCLGMKKAKLHISKITNHVSCFIELMKQEYQHSQEKKKQ